MTRAYVGAQVKFATAEAHLSLRAAATDEERAAAIADWLRRTPVPDRPNARVILAEGVLFDRDGPDGVPLVGLMAGCPCCAGSVPLRVALGRTLRRYRPEWVLLLVANAEHLPRVRRLLQESGLGVRIDGEP